MATEIHVETHKLIRVLLVEDNPGDARLLQETLRETGHARFEMVHVERLDRALQRLGENTIQVVLLDLGLPDSQGLDTLIRIRARAPSLPVIVLTGLDDEELAVRAVREGAQDYLVKGQIDNHLMTRAVRYAIERQQAEKATRLAEEEFRQAQKMEAIGRLAGGVAHDFNNLLAVILGMVDMVLLDLPANSLIRHDLLEIRTAARRAANLTRQLLAFSRRQVVEYRTLDLNEVVLNLEKMLRWLIGEDIDIRLVLAPDVWTVSTDPGQMEQVMVNLAVNARDAMPQGGTLTIETANVVLDEEYTQHHFDVAPGAYVQLSVSDTGEGMTEEVKAHLFEPFFTTKETGKGTGLGLATVYGIVKQSRGHIGVYSEVGQGTVFTIYLPRIQEAAKAVPSEEAGGMTCGTETVLVVEDEATVRVLAAKILRRLGYTVFEAADGEEALSVVQGRAGQALHLLLADVVMPRMGGKEVADRLCAVYPNLKVLLMSGYLDDTIAQHGVTTTGGAFLQKPFLPMELATKVRKVLDAP